MKFPLGRNIDVIHLTQESWQHHNTTNMQNDEGCYNEKKKETKSKEDQGPQDWEEIACCVWVQDDPRPWYFKSCWNAKSLAEPHGCLSGIISLVKILMSSHKHAPHSMIKRWHYASHYFILAHLTCTENAITSLVYCHAGPPCAIFVFFSTGTTCPYIY